MFTLRTASRHHCLVLVEMICVWCGVQAIREDGLPELVEITFSSECVAVPEEPSVCYNSVMPIESVLGVQPK